MTDGLLPVFPSRRAFPAYAFDLDAAHPLDRTCRHIQSVANGGSLHVSSPVQGQSRRRPAVDAGPPKVLRRQTPDLPLGMQTPIGSIPMSEQEAERNRHRLPPDEPAPAARRRVTQVLPPRLWWKRCRRGPAAGDAAGSAAARAATDQGEPAGGGQSAAGADAVDGRKVRSRRRSADDGDQWLRVSGRPVKMRMRWRRRLVMW